MQAGFWHGKTAIVCGATAGLGRSITAALAEQGVGRLAVVARSPDNLQSLAGELRDRYPAVEIVPAAVDLTDRASVEQFAAAFPALDLPARIAGGNQPTGGAGRDVDLLVQAVGQSDRGRIDSLPTERLQGLIETNVVTSLHAIQAFVPRMAPGGTIVLVGSLASLFATRFLGGYAIAKHALAALAHQARRELADRDLHVLLVCPGPIRRPDGGQRYRDLDQAVDLPPQALQPGGGAKLRGLEPQRLARDILGAAERKQALLIRPRKARLLWALSTVCPTLAERILRNRSA
ncbi:MAG: SDR family NAD(P)-dependent oxidoreductase [Planctomycetota bacterium]|nr:MAG: SDR family NAD(P)-dependent oxidoreductase [Planctomycetota bacterium]